MTRFNVINTIQASNGTKLSGVQVNIKLMPSGGFLADTKTEVVRELNVVTDGNGIWTANLESNENVLPSGTWYEVLEKIPKNYGGARTWIIGVTNFSGTVYQMVLPEPPVYTDIIYQPNAVIAKSDWIDLTLLNGAQQFSVGSGYYRGQYRKFDDLVQLRGILQLGDSLSLWTANTPFASLPVGYRAPKLNRYPVNAVPEGQTVSTAMFVTVDPNGNIYPIRNLVNAHVTLDGVTFCLI